MKLFLSLLMIMSLITFAAAQDSPDDSSPNYDEMTPEEQIEQMEKEIEYYMSGARGFLYGFMDGLYKMDSPDISDACLDEEMSLKLARVIYSTESMHMSAFIQVVADVGAIMANFKECGLQSSLYDIKQSCYNSDCSGIALVSNIEHNVFAIIEQLNLFAASYYVFPGDTADILYDQTEQMGLSTGTILRLLLNFKL